MPEVSIPPSRVGGAIKRYVQRQSVVSRRNSRVRLGRCGNSSRQSRSRQREKARLLTPLSAASIPSVTTPLGHRLAGGGLGTSFIRSSLGQNYSGIQSVVVMGFSFHKAFTLLTQMEAAHDLFNSNN